MNMAQCCLQETRWKRSGARIVGKYKFFWMGCDEGTAGVGFLVEESWVERVIEVKRVSERLMVLRVRVDKSVINIPYISAYKAVRV